MSEQIQNQNILTEEEMRARDEAIFDTVAEFRNEMENPELPRVAEYEGIGEDDAAQKVDVDAIFDNRKAELNQPGTGRHRKAFDPEENKAGLMRDMTSSITSRKHRGVPEEHREAYGMVAQHDGSPKPGKKSGKGGKKAQAAAPDTPPELTEDGAIDESALAAAEEAARRSTARPFALNQEPSAALAAPAQGSGRQRRPRTSDSSTPDNGGDTRRIIGDGGIFNGVPEATATPEAEARRERFVQIGSDNVPALYRSTPEYPAHSGDNVLIDQKAMLVSVMDGMGGHGGSEGLDAKAAVELNELVEERFANAPDFKSVRQAEKFMSDTLLECHRAMEKYDDGRGAVGAIVKTIDIKGRLFAVSGIVGDVAVYVRNPGEDEPTQIGVEQSNVNQPNLVLNAFSGSGYDEKALIKRMREDGVSKKDIPRLLPYYANQVITTPLEEGATIAVFTDGIAGDQPEDRLSAHELRSAFDQPSAQDVANELVSTSLYRKNDDKGIGVMRIGEYLTDSDADGGTFDDDATTPDVVTPRARRRDRIAARIGRIIDVEGIRTDLSTARAEMSDAVAQYKRERQARRAARVTTPDLTRDREGFVARNGNKLTVAAAGLGLAAVAAGLGMNSASQEAPSATPRASATETPQYGPQAPKTAETPTPSASPSASQKETPKETPKPTVKPTTPSYGPTAIPNAPDFSNKPRPEEPRGPSSSEQHQTKDFDHETINFTTKDGKVVRASATLKAGGSIFEAGHDAGLTDTQVANAVNEAGITSQRAEQLPVGQQINFDQQADGSYVVHLR